MKTEIQNQVDRIKKALSNWTTIESTAALREGWCLSECCGVKLKLQCQKIDDPEMASQEVGFEVPELESDDLAMKILYKGTGPHHELAKKILQEYEPEEWSLILKAVAG